MKLKLIIILMCIVLCFQIISAEEWGTEKVVCSDFSCIDNWANVTSGNNAGFRIIPSSGVAAFTSVYYPSLAVLTQDIGTGSDKRYNITLNVRTVWFDWNNFWVELGGINSSVFNSSGNKSFIISALNDGNLTIWVNRTYSQSINANVVFESISVKQDTDYVVDISLADGTEENDAFVSQDWIYVNVSSSDFQNITYALYNNSGLVNSTTFTSRITSLNWTGLAPGVYFYNVSMFSTAGGRHWTETRNITVYAPNLNLPFGGGMVDNEGIVNQDWIYVNVSVTADYEDSVIFYLYNATQLINTSTFNNHQRTINWTSLPEGTYWYNVSVSDIFGAVNSTETRSITIYWDTNVASCKTLYGNLSYTQTQDIDANTIPAEILESDCIYIWGDNVNFDGGGYKIKNGGIFLYGSNNSVKGFNLNHLQIVTGRGNTIENGTISNCSYSCLYMGSENPNYNLLKDIYINGSNETGIKFWGIAAGDGENLQGASHNIFQDIVLENIANLDIYTESFFGFGTNMNNTFVNCSYRTSKESVGAQSSLIRKWYYTAYVNNSGGGAVEGANISIYNSTRLQTSMLTNPGGYSTYELVDYVNSAGTRSYSSNYTVFANDTFGHSETYNYNVTSLHNKESVFTFDCWSFQNNLLFVPENCNFVDFGSLLEEVF